MTKKPSEPERNPHFDTAEQEYACRIVNGVEVRYAVSEDSSSKHTDTPSGDRDTDHPADSFDPEHGISDAVDEANAESFPASDPPANW